MTPDLVQIQFLVTPSAEPHCLVGRGDWELFGIYAHCEKRWYGLELPLGLWFRTNNLVDLSKLK